MKFHILSSVTRYLTTLLIATTTLISAHEEFLDHAMVLAICNSPLLREAEARIQMKLAECWQAGICPNPALLINFDQIRSSRRHSVLGRLQATFGISQLIETGGKRSARQNVIATEASAIMWEWEVIKAALTDKLTNAYIEVLAAQEKLKLLDQTYQNATMIAECWAEKVKSGKANSLQQKKSLLIRNAIASDRLKAKSALESAKRQLTLQCGDEIIAQGLINERFAPPSQPLQLNCYLDLVPENPELSQLRTAQLVSYYNYQLQKANRVPDVGISAGIEHNSPQGGLQFYFEFGFELPLFDRNQGNICRAGWETYATLYELQDLQRDYFSRCQDRYAEWQSCYQTIELLNSELIPAAKELLSIHSERKSGGKEDCLEWLQANEDLFSFQMQYIDTVKEFYQLKAALRLLCGEAFDSLDRH